MPCSCDDIRALIREELEKILGKGGPRGSAARRKKRKPSSYNLFMGSCIKRNAGPITERMRGCAVEYKSLPQEEKDRLKQEAASESGPTAEAMLKSVL